MKARSTAFAALSCALLSAAPATAQTTRLERDVEFVRKLAKDLRFIRLAQLEVKNLAQKHRQSERFKQVFQLGIEVSLIGARSHPDRDERRTLFKDALERSKEFIAGAALPIHPARSSCKIRLSPETAAQIALTVPEASPR